MGQGSRYSFSRLPVSFEPDLTNVAGTLFFRADDGVHGAELWKSDGTAAGTALVKDIFPGPDFGYPERLTAVGGTLFFVANDGVNGGELWKSDGTEAGTVLAKDINPNSSYGFPAGSFPHYLTDVAGTLFFAANDGTRGRELWRSDGTAAGTILVADINPGRAGSYPGELAFVNGALFFAADDGQNGREPWVLTWDQPAGTRTAGGPVGPAR